MLFAGRTKSGHHLWPRWWCYLFGGNFRQLSGGYGRVPALWWRVWRYYRQGWYDSYSLRQWLRLGA